jgi:hypothetical protein
MDVRARLLHMDGLDVSVWLHTTKDPPSGEWAVPCGKLGNWVQSQDGDVSKVRLFVVSDGGAANLAQRRELFEDVLRRQPVPTAVVSNSVQTNAVKRGVANVLHLFNPQFQVFEPTQVRTAIEHIGVAVDRFDPIWRTLQYLQVGFPRNATLGLIAEELGIPLLEGRPSSWPPSVPPPAR